MDRQKKQEEELIKIAHSYAQKRNITPKTKEEALENLILNMSISVSEKLELLEHFKIKSNKAWFSHSIQIPKNQKKSGYVYFIKDNDSKKIKIGSTFNIGKRIKSFETGNASDLSVFLSIKTIDHKKLETEIHKAFKPFLYKNEWYSLEEIGNKNIHRIIDIVLGVKQ